MRIISDWWLGVTERDLYTLFETRRYEGKNYYLSLHENPRTDFGTPITISYGFATQGLFSDGFGRARSALGKSAVPLEFTLEQRVEMRKILDEVASMTNITFEEKTGSDAEVGSADYLFMTGKGDLAYGGAVYRDHRVLIMNEVVRGSPINGQVHGYILAHELGHVLGFAHTSDAPSLPARKLTKTNSVMGGASFMLSLYVRDLGGDKFSMVKRYSSNMQHLDVLGLLATYGPNDARRGDDVYNFQDALDRESVTLGLQRVLTDPGGVDTFEGSSSRPNWIDLDPGSWSDLGYGYSIWLSKASGLQTATKDYLERVYKGKYNVLLALGTDMENAKGGSEDDYLGGNEWDNLLEGLGGDDELRGYGGTDRLFGGGGGDVLEGGSGWDELDGGEGGDVVLYSASPRGVRVSLADGYGEDGYGGRDRLKGVEHVVGSKFGDMIKGGAGANILAGGGGMDVLEGGDGNDFLGGSSDEIGGFWGYGVGDLRGLLPSGARVSGSWGGSMAYEAVGGVEVLVVGDEDGEGGHGRIDIFVRNSSGVWEWKASKRGPSSGSQFGQSVDILDGYVGVGVPGSGKKQFGVSQAFDVFHLYKWTGTDLESYAREEKTGTFDGVGLGLGVRLYTQGGKLFVSGFSRKNFGLSKQPTASYGIEVVRDDGNKKFSLQGGQVFEAGVDFFVGVEWPGAGGAAGYDVVIFNNPSVSSGSPPLFAGYDTRGGVATLLFSKQGFFATEAYASSGLRGGKALAVEGHLVAASISIEVNQIPSDASDLLTGVSGIVQVFRHVGGIYKQEALLSDESVSEDDDFGESLALWSGGGYDYLAVGAPRFDDALGKGAVYVYRYEGERGWILHDKFSAPKATVRGFGTDVTFTSDGGLVVSSSDGEVYVYDFLSLAPKGSFGVEGDRLFGGSGDDILVSSMGPDILDGGPGTDEVFYADYSSEYTFVSRRSHILEVKGNGVTDRLYSIERIKFLDKVYEVEWGALTGRALELDGLKLKLPQVVDNVAPVMVSRSVEASADSVTVKATLSEEGRMYGLVRKEGEVSPDVMEVVMEGREVRFEGRGEQTLTVDGLSSGTDYVPYVVLEDERGNRSEVRVVVDEVTTQASVLSNLTLTKKGSSRHEVTFRLDGDGFVYYGYSVESEGKPSADEMREGLSHFWSSGVTWVDGKGDHKIYLPFLGKGEGKIYIMSDGEGIVHEADVSPLWEEDGDVWGLSFGVSDFV
jgi:Ca2+-binding RTX toxin-like protein